MSDAPTGPSRSDGFRVAVIATGEDRAGVAGPPLQWLKSLGNMTPSALSLCHGGYAKKGWKLNHRLGVDDA
jgi:hypothetical protein